MSTESSAFTLAFVGLLGAPIAAPSLAWLFGKLPPAKQVPAYVVLAGLAIIPIALATLGLSSISYEVNAAAILLAFWSVLTLSVSAFRLRSRLLRYPLGAVAVVLLLVSLFMGTIGSLGTAFIVGDTVPIYTAEQDKKHNCYVTSYGNATTDTGGYHVTITARQSFALIMERTIIKRSYEEPPQTPAELCRATFKLRPT